MEQEAIGGRGGTMGWGSGPCFQSQMDHSCVILSRPPPLSEPHLFSSNVEQPDSRGPSRAVSSAAGTEEGGSVDHLGGRAGSRTEPAQVPGSVFWTARVEAGQAVGSGSGLAWWVGGYLQVPCPPAFVHLGLTALHVCRVWPRSCSPAHTWSTFTAAGGSAQCSTWQGRRNQCTLVSTPRLSS